MNAHTETPVMTNWLTTLEQEARTLLEELDTHPEARRLFDGSVDKDGYVHYLLQTYHYARWTTPLLAEAGRRMKRLGLHSRLGDLLLQKSDEERGHERWLLADLKNLGWPAERVERQLPNPAVTAYVAWNRFTSRCGRPEAFLGTAYVLEYLSVHRASQSVERMLAANTIPNIRKAVTFLKAHGTADEKHVEELTSLLSALTDREEQAALLLSARTTRVLYLGLFAEEARGNSAHPS
ncbi:MAG TPA: iron-containing redox enzyme family protein [Archangium sp.]|uniref:iron-containing redox enzyme family protein n=1 Tax=Archangium sp. TaxID=1872627 RepID=UPI002E349D2A|nr:iron-containing redox enzyme family protein [Archangium sp.]HEX5752441.1 iron-containing redox enzyme family protein [Archangium sp.]